MTEKPLPLPLTPEEELAFAKTIPGGMELSPEAQALYEAEGAARFAQFHQRGMRQVSKTSTIGLDNIEAEADESRVIPTKSEAEQVCAEAHQVVGVLLSESGQFATDRGIKILDNLSAGRLVHKDVLPWVPTDSVFNRTVEAMKKAMTTAEIPAQYRVGMIGHFCNELITLSGEIHPRNAKVDKDVISRDGGLAQ
jgi:hypothetical protein